MSALYVGPQSPELDVLCVACSSSAETSVCDRVGDLYLVHYEMPRWCCGHLAQLTRKACNTIRIRPSRGIPS